MNLDLSKIPGWFSSRVASFTPGTCWEWTGALSKGRYGQIPRRIGTRKAHRFIYELLRGPIPEGMTIDHLCKCTRCVNPAHMEVVSAQENVLRSDCLGMQNKRKTHCCRGHELAGRNLIIQRTGKRNCRECVNAALRKNRAMRRQKGAVQ